MSKLNLNNVKITILIQKNLKILGHNNSLNFVSTPPITNIKILNFQQLKVSRSFLLQNYK